MQEALRNGDINFKRAYIRLFVDEITLRDREVELIDPTDTLANAVSRNGLPPTADMVPSFVRKWRPVCNESNNWNALN